MTSTKLRADEYTEIDKWSADMNKSFKQFYSNKKMTDYMQLMNEVGEMAMEESSEKVRSIPRIKS